MKEKHKHLIILTLAAIAIPIAPTILFFSFIAEIFIFYYIYRLIRNILYFMMYIIAFLIYLFILYKFYYPLFHTNMPFAFHTILPHKAFISIFPHCQNLW